MLSRVEANDVTGEGDRGNHPGHQLGKGGVQKKRKLLLVASHSPLQTEIHHFPLS